MLISQNIVLAARQFYPAFVGEHWLLTNNIATAVFGNKISTEMVSSHSTSRFDLVIIPDKATFNLKLTAPIEQTLDEVRAFIRQLPDPRYWAVGFNFGYRLTEDGEDVRKFSQKFQFQPECNGIHGSNTVWGSLAISPGPHGSALRTHITPTFPDQNPLETPQMLLGEFNVNFTIINEDKSQAEAVMAHFSDCVNHVIGICATLATR